MLLLLLREENVGVEQALDLDEPTVKLRASEDEGQLARLARGERRGGRERTSLTEMLALSISMLSRSRDAVSPTSSGATSPVRASPAASRIFQTWLLAHALTIGRNGAEYDDAAVEPAESRVRRGVWRREKSMRMEKSGECRLDDCRCGSRVSMTPLWKGTR